MLNQLLSPRFAARTISSSSRCSLSFLSFPFPPVVFLSPFAVIMDTLVSEPSTSQPFPFTWQNNLSNVCRVES